MQIQVNGESQSHDDGLTINELLEALKLADQRVAVEINQEIVPRSTFTDQRISEGDKVEIVRAIGGG